MPIAERRFLSFDARPIFYRETFSDSAPLATILIIHGMAEHGGRYEPLMRALSAAGIDSVAPDLRGFGRSAGRRGDSRSINDFTRDLAALYRLMTRRTSCPVFVLGHSFGGFLACRLLTDQPDVKPRGLVLSSPLVEHAVRIAPWKKLMAWAASYVWPSYSEHIPINPKRLTHDAKVLERDSRDSLLHYRMTARFYRLLMQALKTFPARAARLRCPVLLLQAGEDEVVSRAAAERFFEQLGSGDKQLHVYPGLYHEILNEIQRESIYATLTAWILERARPQG